MFYKYAEIGARIAAVGSYLPDRIVANTDIPGLEESDGQIRRLLGAVERRAASEEEACSDLIVKAARQILCDARISADDLDRIIVSATPGDFHEPSTASIVQFKLGAQCPAVDMGMSCVGWVAAVDYALRCIKTGDRRVLIMAGTVVSRGSRFHNPMHRAIFGDGAGGVLLEASTSGCFRSGMLWTAGQYYDVIHQPHIGSIHPAQVPEEYRGSFYMGHREVIFDVLRANIGPVVDGVLGAAGLCREHVDCCFIHEPSKPLYEEAVRGSGLAREKCIEYYDRHGNTISAELPISLDETIRAGGVARGDTILMVTFGAGFNGGALVFEY